jgi:hypothetical protein
VNPTTQTRVFVDTVLVEAILLPGAAEIGFYPDIRGGGLAAQLDSTISVWLAAPVLVRRGDRPGGSPGYVVTDPVTGAAKRGLVHQLVDRS